MVYKMNESIIVIQAEATSPNRTNVVFWSHDRGTAKLRMKLVRKDGIPQSLPEGTTVPIRLMFKSATAEGGYGKHDYLATVEDPVNGIVSIVLEDNILGYVGTVEGSVYIDFPNDRSLDTAGRFTFSIKRSPIDDSTPELEDYYFNGFSQTIDKIEQIVSNAKTEIGEKVAKSETQIDTKVKDTNDKITKANQDVTTLNTNIDKANDRIDQTNQQIGDLGKLKKMYSNSIDFGGYDYSGRANLFLNLDFSKLSRNASAITEPPAYVKDGGSHFVLDFSDPSANGVDRSVFIPGVGRLEKGATYIATVPIMISDDFSTDYGASPIYPYCVSANNVTTRVVVLNPDNSCRGKWGFIKKTFTVPANVSDGEFTYFQVHSTKGQVGKLYIGYDIKIEKVTSTSDTATAYQPNLLDAPYYLSKVALGENIAPNISKYKYFGEGLKDSDNPNDYSWDITPEYAEKSLNNTVSLTEPQTVLGLKNFSDGIQIAGDRVVGENEHVVYTLDASNSKSFIDGYATFIKHGKIVIVNGTVKFKKAYAFGVPLDDEVPEEFIARGVNGMIIGASGTSNSAKMIYVRQGFKSIMTNSEFAINEWFTFNGVYWVGEE